MKWIFLLLFFFSKNTFSQQVKVQSYKEFSYSSNDTLNFCIKNITSKKIKISFSLDLYYRAKWGEVDNDIYEEKPKVFHFFYLSKDYNKKFSFPILLIDSIYLKEIKNPKFRIILNIYQLHPFRLTRYLLNEFIVNNDTNKIN